ncbi:MAG: hypothetical protein ACXQS8_05385 [Candidatus Helarchaeales archaeon]
MMKFDDFCSRKDLAINRIEIAAKEKDAPSVSQVLQDLERKRISVTCCGTLLDWHEFESLCIHVFQANEFECCQNVRFSLPSRKRHEIDIVAVRGSFVLSVDAKNWRSRPGKSSQIKLAMEKQIERTRELAMHPFTIEKYFPNFSWSGKKFFPVLVTSLQESISLHDGCPIVPFSSLDSFLQEFLEYHHELRCFVAD